MAYLLFFFLAGASTLGLLWWWYREIQRNPAMAMSIALFYSLFSKQVSLLFIEMIPSYLPEQDMFSRWTGVSWRVLLMHVVFVTGLVVTCRVLNRIFPLRSIAERHILFRPPTLATLDLSLIAVVVLLLVQAVNILLSRGAAGLSSDFSRYDFWDESARFPILATVFGKTMAFVPPLLALANWGYGLERARQRQMLSIALLVPYWLFLHATGHRFTMTVLNFGLFLSVLMLLRTLEGESPISKNFAIGALGVLTLAIVVGSYDLTTRFFARNSANAFDAFFERAFVIQGATLWAVDDTVINHNTRGNWRYLLDGMSEIRHLVLSRENAAAYSERGVNLSAGLPAICQLAFGPLFGTLVIVFFGIYLALIFHLYSAVIAKGSIMGLCLGALVLSWSNSVYGVASLLLILEPKNAVFIVLLVIILSLPPVQLSFSRSQASTS